MSTLTLSCEGKARLRLAIADPELKGIALGITAALIWGSYLALARAGISAGLTASDIAFIRYGVAGTIMLPWLVANGIHSCGGVGWTRGSVLALLVGPLFILIGVGGYAFAPLAHGAVLQPAALTIGSMALATLVLSDHPSPARVIGAGIMLGGLVVIAGPGLITATELTPMGDAMFIVAGLMWAVFTILSRRWKIPAMAATAAVSVLSAAAFVPGYLVLVGPDRLLAAEPTMLLSQVVVQGVLSGVVAVIAFTKAVELIGAARAAVFPALVPAAAIVLGIPIAGEIPTGVQIAGLAIVSLGLLFAVGVVKLPGSMGR